VKFAAPSDSRGVVHFVALYHKGNQAAGF